MSCTQNIEIHCELLQFMDQQFVDTQVLFIYVHQVMHYLSYVNDLYFLF